MPVKENDAAERLRQLPFEEKLKLLSPSEKDALLAYIDSVLAAARWDEPAPESERQMSESRPGRSRKNHKRE